MPQEFEKDVQAAIDQGKKVTAIKLLREHRGLGLREAKELIDGCATTIASPAGSSNSNKTIINSVILALIGFAIYKIFLEPS